MDAGTPIGKSRFLYFLNKVQCILEKAEVSQFPAGEVYRWNMRTPLFMLEGLSWIYKKVADHKRFKKLHHLFKDLEDRLGAIDFYDGFHKEFISEGKIPDLILLDLEDKKDQKLIELNRVLKKEDWTGTHKKHLSKIRKELDEIKWFDEKNDTAAIREVYENHVTKIIRKYKIEDLQFTSIESDVHELRRELRWLSIFPQALLGLMQLKMSPTEDFLKKYLTPETISSPYNVMPDGGGLQQHIMLNSNQFYALSWTISELGKLKDSGLKIELLEQSVASVYKTKEPVEQLVYSLCGKTQPTIQQILEQSQKITKTFFEEDILENLIAGTGS